jgi:hypothetical protein
MLISFFFLVNKKIFKFFIMWVINGRKGSGLVGWLYNSKKQQLAHQVDQIYKPREQGHHVQNTDVLKRDDEKYCKLLVLRPTPPPKK